MSKQKQHPTAKHHSPNYYKELCVRLAAQGRSRPNSAPNTKKCERSLLRKVSRYCCEQGIEQKIFLRKQDAAELKTFWRWVLDNYKVGARSSLSSYSRLLAKIVLDDTGRGLDEGLRSDVRNYPSHLRDEYRLRKIPKRKLVITGLDDLYHVLHAHWVLAKSTFKDEHQRVMFATGILAAAYFGCRLVTLFDTRVKFDDPDDSEAASWIALHADTSGGVVCRKKRTPDAGSTSDEKRKLRRGIKPSRSDNATHKMMGFSSTSRNDEGEDSDTDMDSETDGITIDGSDASSNAESDAESMTDDEFDDDSCTDDEYDGGTEETGAFLYRHFTIFVAPNPNPAMPNLVFMKAALLHTKEEDNNPRMKIITIDSEEDDVMFSLVDHLISLALHDNAFETKAAKIAQNMFWVQMPEGKESMELKWRRDALDKPVFRQPLRKAYGPGTSQSEPLRAGTWMSYLRRLGETAGMKHPLTQYAFRRGLLNTVNSRAPPSVSHQLFDHKIGSEAPYLDQEIRCDTKACFLGRPSNEVVQRLARCAKLTVDMCAPTKPPHDERSKLEKHPKVVRLSERNKKLTAELHAKGYRPISTAKDTDLYAKKKRIEARLNSTRIRIWDKMCRKYKKRHYRSADTLAFDAQFSSASSKVQEAPKLSRASTINYAVPERAELVRLMSQSIVGLSEAEQLARRIQVIELRAALCGRQEALRRRTTQANPKTRNKKTKPNADSQSDGDDSEDPDEGPNAPYLEDDGENLPLICRPTQCTFCLGNTRLPYPHRIFEYSRPNKMMDHVENCHLSRFGPSDPIRCRHPVCKSQNLDSLPGIAAFKSHTAKVHKIKLRAFVNYPTA